MMENNLSQRRLIAIETRRSICSTNNIIGKLAADDNKTISEEKNNHRYDFFVKNRYEYSCKREKINFELIEEPDGFSIISCKGMRYPVEIVSRSQNFYEVLVNGVSYCFSVETPFSLTRNKLLSAFNKKKSNGSIKAPMPGKVLEVMVETGQFIRPGEALLVLEAMKMQNSILSQISGTVKSIGVKKDDNVAKDCLLFEIDTSLQL